MPLFSNSPNLGIEHRMNNQPIACPGGRYGSDQISRVSLCTVRLEPSFAASPQSPQAQNHQYCDRPLRRTLLMSRNVSPRQGRSAHTVPIPRPPRTAQNRSVEAGVILKHCRPAVRHRSPLQAQILDDVAIENDQIANEWNQDSQTDCQGIYGASKPSPRRRKIDAADDAKECRPFKP